MWGAICNKEYHTYEITKLVSCLPQSNNLHYLLIIVLLVDVRKLMSKDSQNELTLAQYCYKAFIDALYNSRLSSNGSLVFLRSHTEFNTLYIKHVIVLSDHLF